MDTKNQKQNGKQCRSRGDRLLQALLQLITSCLIWNYTICFGLYGWTDYAAVIWNLCPYEAVDSQGLSAGI